MPSRSLPVRPNLDQLKHQAKDLLKAYRAGTVQAAAAFAAFHPEGIAPARARLADAQLVVARSYQASSWTRLVQCCQLINAIWDDDPDAVERLVNANPNLLTDTADIHGDNWGPPLRSAMFLERRWITRKLEELGAAGLAHAFERAGLRGRLQEALAGAAYTLSVRDTEFLFRMGARVRQGAGTPVETVIGSDSRRPADKRRILAIYEDHGYEYPATPVMAFHRGRFDLLEQHLARDPGLLARTFAIQEIFPLEVGCGQQPYEAMGTPVDGGTLLHLAVYWDELDMATWLLDQGADPNGRAAMDADGFGGRDQNPRPRGCPHQKEWHRDRDQPAGDQNQLSSVAIGELSGRVVRQRLGQPKHQNERQHARSGDELELPFGNQRQNAPLHSDHRTHEGIDDDQESELRGVLAEAESERPRIRKSATGHDAAALSFLPGVSMGNPAAFHSGNPSPRRRARRPFARRISTARSAYTQ
jgi:hypothetical protein